MSKHDVLIGQIDYSVLVFLTDASTGAPETGLDNTEVDFSYTRVETDNDVVVTGSITPVLLASLTAAHTDWGFKEVDATEAPGLYRLDIADAVFSSGAWSAVVFVRNGGSNDIAPVVLEFQLVAHNPQSAGVNVSQFGGVNGTFSNGRPEVILGNVAHGGTVATLQLKSVQVVNADSDAVYLESTESSSAGMRLIGTQAGVILGGPSYGAFIAADQAGILIDGGSGPGMTISGATGGIEANITGNVTGNLSGTIGGLATAAKAEIQMEAEEALQTYHLDHLIASADPGSVAANNSFLAKLVSKNATAAFSSYNNTTDSLEAQRDRVLAKGTDITGFNDLSTGQVNSECDTALSDVGLTTTVTGRIDAAITTRATPAQVNSECDTALSDVGLTSTVTGRIDAAITTRATPAQVNSECDTALADVGLTTTITGRIDTTVSSRASQTSLDTVASYVDTEVTAIKAKTDNLPGSPAAVGSAMTLASGAITSATFGSGAVNAAALNADAATEVSDSVWGAASRTLTSGELRDDQTVPGIPPTTPTQYAAGKAIGTQITFNFSGVTRGAIVGCRVLDKDKESKPLELWLFRASTTDGTSLGNNYTFNPSPSQLANLMGVVRINDWFDANANSIGQAENLPLAVAELSTGNVYGWVVARGAPSYVENDLIVELELLPG